ncbi:MAG: hypothetical protein PWQ42_243 [Sulfurospirillum sp.]|jgi:hypothetical protein|nr:hypothetical protein [Sulfurospirillum sp.]DAB32782.1 MAG TPA: hypothetical protein CFH79_02040 [Sulfurospirillum sp. UBA11407]DAB33242.1 MAG TPA: hypothetical protein CFH82_11560 [Sulfurospirillum sp. UBA12182]
MSDKEKKELSIYEIINAISKDIGISDKTVIQIEGTQDPDIKRLSLQSGSWEASEPWFIVDEQNKLHTMISMDSVNKIITNFKAAQQENFNLKLEKTIWQNVPIDFQDVWAVAMDEIRMLSKDNGNSKVINVDLEALVGKIKKEHPNLFIDLKDLQILK